MIINLICFNTRVLWYIHRVLSVQTEKNQLNTAHKVLMQLTDRFIIMKTWKEDNTNVQINITGSVLSVNLIQTF